MAIRSLRADEIECRVSTASEKGVSLLLYKDARVDMRILDETYGPMNWKRSHQLIGDNLYCTIEVRDRETGDWIGKQDVGTESNTEKEKGQASDSFKRAGFNWGIGRELYTAPFIWVNAKDCVALKTEAGKTKCYDRFRVASIRIEAGVITALEIVNVKTGKTVFSMGQEQVEADLPITDVPISEAMYKVLAQKCKEKGKSLSAILAGRQPSEMLTSDWKRAIAALDAV